MRAGQGVTTPRWAENSAIFPPASPPRFANASGTPNLLGNFPVRPVSAPVLLPLFVALLLLGAGAWLAGRRTAPPHAPPSPARAAADAGASPAEAAPRITDSAELTRLRAENARLREQLDAAFATLIETSDSLDATRSALDRLRRPLELDLSSSTLRANLSPGEGVVTGGHRLPDGRRLFALVATDARADGAVDVAGRFFAVPEELVPALGLQTLVTEAANTLQHGEVWVREELESVATRLEQTPSARLLATGGAALRAGEPGEVTLPTGTDGPPLTLGVNFDYDARRNLDLELRVESPAPAPSETTPTAAISSATTTEK